MNSYKIKYNENKNIKKKGKKSNQTQNHHRGNCTFMSLFKLHISLDSILWHRGNPSSRNVIRCLNS